MESYQIPERQELEDLKDTVKSQLLERFGQVMNLDTMQIEYRPWEEINLLGNCGEVSEITQKIVGGEKKELIHTKPNAELTYVDISGNSKVIADGHTYAIHSYVVADDLKVWDPTLDCWGNTDETEYLSHIIKN